MLRIPGAARSLQSSLGNGWRQRAVGSSRGFAKRRISETEEAGKSYQRSGLVMTRITATIGPSSEAKEVMQSLADEGMKIARLNFSHAVDYNEMTGKVQKLRTLEGAHRRVGHQFNLRGILLDTKGPEIRTGRFEGGVRAVEIPPEGKLVLTTDPAWAEKGTAEKIFIDYPSLGKTVTKGSSILLDDGIIKLEVLEPVMGSSTGQYTDTLCVVKNKSVVTLGARKGTNIPGASLDLPALTERDKQDLEWGIKNDVDFVAASFVRKGSDVRSIVAYLERLTTKIKPCMESNPRGIRPLLISKIENQEAVENFDEILEESDGIMVARGDLGVECPFESVFSAQKIMVKKANDAGKPVIVATQMLDSMMRNPRPTRAEVSDVGNAVLDGADCVMLSGETAAGKYPVESVQAMTRVLVRADGIIDEVDPSQAMDPMSLIKRARKFASKRSPNRKGSHSAELDAVALCTVMAAAEIEADLIIVLTTRGEFARAIARYRPSVPVMCFCTELKVARQLQLHRGLFPVLPPDMKGASVEDVAEAIRTAKEIGWIKPGELAVVSNYEQWDTPGLQQSMNMRVLRIT